MSRPTVDRAFLALLILDAAVTSLFLLWAGLGPWLGTTGSLPLLESGRSGIVPGLVAVKFVLNSVLLCGAARRRAPLTGPSPIFLLLAAGSFLGLAIQVAAGLFSAARALGSASVLGLLPVFVIACLLCLGGRNLGRMWRFYQQESLILLCGIWVLLFGSVGMDILGGLFSATGQMRMVGTALGDFCQMTGASILLYGVLRFALRKERLDGLLRPVRC